MSDSELPTDTSRDPQVEGGSADAEHDATTKDAHPGSDASSRGGQVSEVGSMDPAAADIPISDDQSVAGNPTEESGDTQEPGEAGPNAIPEGNAESAEKA